jgi:glycosyltransferase involved in cell wall biosynthesis
MVSIIIPFHNDWIWLPHALGSCLMHDVKTEIIIVDDFSGPPSSHILKLIDCVADRYIRHDKNKGLAASRNTGIRYCKYDLICWLDADDWLYNNALDYMVNAMDENTDVVHGNLTEYDDGPIGIPPGRNGITKEKLLIDNQIWCTHLERKSLWEKVGGFDEYPYSNYEDFRYNCKTFLSGARYKYIDKLIYRHTARPDSMLSELHLKTKYFKEFATQPLRDI